MNLIKTILNNKANNDTPIIFIYDGHGSTTTGYMSINSSLLISNLTFINLFLNNKINNKLFIFTQCGSYNFYTSLNLTELPNSVFICSTNKIDICGYSAQVLLQFSKLLNTEKYLTFNKMKSDFEKDTIFFLNDPNNIEIENILKLYIPNIPQTRFNVKDEIYFTAKVRGITIYLGYDINKYRTLDSINNTKKLWLISNRQVNNNEYYFSFSTKETYTYNGSKYNAFLDWYSENSNELCIWSENTSENTKQKFKINDDLSIQSPDNYYLLYDVTNNKFIRGSSYNDNFVLVKMVKDFVF